MGTKMRKLRFPILCLTAVMIMLSARCIYERASRDTIIL